MEKSRGSPLVPGSAVERFWREAGALTTRRLPQTLAKEALRLLKDRASASASGGSWTHEGQRSVFAGCAPARNQDACRHLVLRCLQFTETGHADATYAGCSTARTLLHPEAALVAVTAQAEGDLRDPRLAKEATEGYEQLVICAAADEHGGAEHGIFATVAAGADDSVLFKWGTPRGRGGKIVTSRTGVTAWLWNELEPHAV